MSQILNTTNIELAQNVSGISRRNFFLFNASAATQINRRPEVNVVIFLRGGADGLNLVPPLSGEDRKIYESERPNIKIPLTGDGALLPLDERFGLHPSAPELLTLFRKGKLAIVHAAGLNTGNRSHFDSQLMMELGTPGTKAGTSGYLARSLARDHRGIAIGGLLPTSLLGCPSAFSLSANGNLALSGDEKKQEQIRLSLRAMYSGHSWIDHSGSYALDALDLVDDFKSAETKKDTSGLGELFPKGDLGTRMFTLLRLMKLPLGIRAASIDFGGWDTHKNQGTGTEGKFADQVAQLSGSISVLMSEIEKIPLEIRPVMKLIVMTEFGRRLKENANKGTDHGHGGVMMVAGENISGGKILGRWPGLANADLYERADLAVTTDYRQVVSETFNFAADSKIFPGFKHSQALNLTTHA